MAALHETCPQYVARRLSEGWRIISRKGFNVVLQSPEGIIRPVDLRNDIETLRPNAAGDEESIDNEGGNGTGDHHELVDEAVADDGTTHVKTTSSSYLRDLYNIDATSLTTETINSIKIYFRCVEDFGGTCFAKPSLKSNSTVTDGTEVALTISWADYSQTWTTNPADSQAWEVADLADLQIGESLKGDGSNDAWCTQVYVEVDYTLGAQTISSAGAIASLEAFGTPVTAGPITCTGIASLEAFGTPITAGPITCTGIASLEAFGTHHLSLRVAPSAIATLEAFGTPIVAGPIICTSIASLEAFGTPVVVGPITCTGIASLEAFGTHQLNMAMSAAGAIASLEAFGSHQLNMAMSAAGAIASLEAFGTPVLILYLLPSGIASLEAFGAPIIVAGPITCSGIASLEAFGTPQLNLTIFPSAIASLEAFGTPTLMLYLLPSSIASLEAFGTPQLNLTIFPSAIASAEAFGLIDVIIRVYPAGALGYIIEVRDSSDNLLAFLENAHGINLIEQLNRPPMLDFRLPADDSKISHISPDNEYWLRNYETGVLVRKFLLSRRRDTRD